jgi:hypothetical protein
MSSVDKERELIRLYLLGQLTEEDRERLEERLVTDLDYQEEVLTVEEELIEDYVSDSLASEDKEKFQAHWLVTPRQRRRLEIGQALDRFCANTLTVEVPAAKDPLSANETRPTPINSQPSFFRRPIVPYALAAVVLIAVSAAAWVFFSGRRQTDFAREFARVNNRQNNGTKPDFSVTLLPNTLRETEPARAVPRGANVVEIVLALPSHEHKTYQVTLRGGNLRDKYLVNNLDSTVSNVGTTVRVNIPTTHLLPGDYFLELGGVTSNGINESIADYRFRISN